MSRRAASPTIERTGVRALRRPTLESLGLGGVLETVRRGALPARADELVERVFGPPRARGSLVISGAGGIVGAGKTMQLGARLAPHGVRVVALDLPGAPDGIGRHYPGLVQAFGRDGADRIMANVVRLAYDGKRLPDGLADLQPRFLLEAIPEILDLKKAHYALFRAAYPGIEIRSVTSGFPSAQLGVAIAHPAFPHEINKVWEVVEPEPSDATRLFWALGMIPVPVSDHWSFVLDVLFCGLTLAGLRAHRATNMPFWKLDKLTRRLLGPNPFRAHDAIGAKGADFLTWSCLHHLSEHYGPLFRATPELVERKDTGQTWYPPDHLRPLVDWTLSADEHDEFRTRLLGPLFQMTSLLLHERRAQPAQLNAIGELCAQFRRGVLAVLREVGAAEAVRTVEAWRRLDAEAERPWHPEAFERMDDPEWRQLYVNAEHDGEVGVVTIGRESYSWDVDRELNRALDWLEAEGVRRVILTGDFHLATQMVGADTSDFFSALDRVEDGLAITTGWPSTARRLADGFAVSVALIDGKRCLGGMLELAMHCHYGVAVDDARLGWPEVTLPVVPGMEACHWPFRRTGREHWPKLLLLLLGGRAIPAAEAVGWLIDAALPLEAALATAWKLAAGGDHGLERRPLEAGPLAGVPVEAPGRPPAAGPLMEAARRAIVDCVRQSCAAPLGEALAIQARHAAGFLAGETCRAGRVGTEAARVLRV